MNQSGQRRYSGRNDMTILYKCTKTQRCYCKISPDPENWYLLRPEIVVLCGSTRFMDAFHTANRELSLAGKIVLTVELVTYDGATDPQRADPEQKQKLDELHHHKIELADSVLVLNVDGYIGKSTAEEIAYAESLDKPIAYLEEVTSHL